MNLTKLSLSELHPDPENPRIHDERNLKIIMDGLGRFGQYRPYVVQKQGMVIRVGNGMHEAMTRLNWAEPVDCVILDLTDDLGRTLSILDNRASELSSFDDVQMAEQLAKLDDAVRTFCGFSSEEIDRLLDTSVPTFREDVDPSRLEPFGTKFRIGDHLIKVTRPQYDAWVEDLRCAAGLAEADIVREIRRRLAI